VNCCHRLSCNQPQQSRRLLKISTPVIEWKIRNNSAVIRGPNILLHIAEHSKQKHCNPDSSFLTNAKYYQMCSFNQPFSKGVSSKITLQTQEENATVRTIVYESCTLTYYSGLQRITTGKECIVANSRLPACDRPRNSNRDRVAHRSDNSVVTFWNNCPPAQDRVARQIRPT